MAKYIDAEKLKEMMLPSYEEAKKESLSVTDVVKWEKVEYIFDFVFHLIDSLQQEQRETDGDDGKFVKILVRKEFAEQIQRLGDKIQAGQSSFVRAMNQQEQPEMDLEKEIDAVLESSLQSWLG